MRLPPGALMVVGLALLAASCGSGAIERIREANDAERSGSSVEVDPTIRATIHSNDLQVGDCLSEDVVGDAGADEIERVVVVLCSAEWRQIVIDSFEVSRSGSYPGIAFFEEKMFQRCDPATTDGIFPAESNWDAGQRAVRCFVASESIVRPEVGDCFDIGVDDVLTIELRRSCDQPHTLEAFAVLPHHADAFPGIVAMAEFATPACVEPFEQYVLSPYEMSEVFTIWVAPTRGTWELLGEREIYCYLFVPTEAGEFETLTRSLEGARR